jgi:putative salt-induced outer membrane protein YdiY
MTGGLSLPALVDKIKKMKRARRLPFGLCALLILYVACLRVAVAEDGPPHKRPAKWKGNLSLGLSLARGNADTLNISLTFSAVGPIDKNKALSNNGFFLFGQLNGETIAESLLADTRLDWRHTRRFFSYYRLQVGSDRFKNYSYRILPALGAGYDILAYKALSLEVDLGFSGVIERYYDTDLTHTYAGLRGGLDLDWKISETAEFTEKLEVVSAASRLSNYFLRFEANVVAALTQSWALKLTLADSYDNRPLGTKIKRNDVVLIAGISRKF